MTTKNALLTSLELFVDLTTIYLTLHFEYADGIQQTGALKLTDDLLRAVANATDEREILKVKDKPCRVQIDAVREEIAGTLRNQIVGFGHFLRDEWFTIRSLPEKQVVHDQVTKDKP